MYSDQFFVALMLVSPSIAQCVDRIGLQKACLSTND
ncbi:hypothetical protein SNOG_05453 [Parastagonospora nodorum SN15]|uniref:Uncharacterized protein n=1 Tax=Phaeosphaeria nodorum (strain SN15 / ATCC MYA-4574 / FGSC 10173) TaxID=321614 RepID=Q0US11_PHANO|nr:hypothetical protein SNOG_05453 [Parastagonospora nodorum SN15]EAT87844.1 hypothetical protein SNOG_05453 [Parastagonospora nodorum SN15]